VVIGEPGIGKSRLLSELRAAVAGPDYPTTSWIEGHCVTYGRTVPYHLVLDMVRSMIGISMALSEAEERQVLEARLNELLGSDAADAIPYFAHLLSLPLSAEETDRLQIEPDVLQGRYVSSIHRVIKALAANGPIVLVCEDIHWSDPASVDVLLQLVPLISLQPVLLILLGRAETDAPGWRLVTTLQSTFGAALTELRLQPLSDAEGRELVANLLEVEALPDTVRDNIMARSEGNPFFVEEVIRMLIERGAIVRSGDRWMANESINTVEIPETLHSLLLARIDQLPDDAKRSLRVASVIGRQFPVRVLERVLSTD